MTSTSGNDGTSAITITFDIARNLDAAAVDVQNRISQAEGRLPNEVKQVGISVTKVSSNFVIAAAAYAEHDEYDPLFISNYLDRFVVDAIRRVPGVGQVMVFGIGRYAMRLWLDPDKLAGRNLTADEVVQALREQNVQVAAGAVGAEPSQEGQSFQISVRAVGRLSDPARFDNADSQRSPDFALVRVKDVTRRARPESYTTADALTARRLRWRCSCRPRTRPGVCDVSAEIERLSRRFPARGLSRSPETTTVAARVDSRGGDDRTSHRPGRPCRVPFLQNGGRRSSPRSRFRLADRTFAFVKLFASINS